ncbi:ABC transporter permease [Nonomuraea sp. NPDC047529]|uniref:ABC transporter permease n=1 Tax=Nonomuraea sp. NPDC047529 TaxID=3155623 RepID=UPI0033C9A353
MTGRSLMFVFVLRRIGLALLSAWGVATIVFLMTKLIPGDPARVAAGRFASGEQVEQVRHAMGLDQPLFAQYGTYLARAAAGDLGTSAYTHQGVTGDLAAALPNTVQLVLAGMLITVLVAVPLGVAAAVSQGRAADVAARIILVLAGGVPIFWFAIMLRWTLGFLLGWFPLSGTNAVGLAPPDVTGFTVLDSLLFGDVANVLDSLAHLVLPALALSVPFVATLARNVRSNMITALGSDYIDFAVSKGVPRGQVIVRHALRSAMGSTLTLFGMQFGWMVSASVLVEAVFSFPGVGSYLYKAIVNNDTFAVLGAVLIVGVVFIVSSAVVDLLQMLLDPRVRTNHLRAA